jgi:hypothetical protein
MSKKLFRKVAEFDRYDEPGFKIKVIHYTRSNSYGVEIETTMDEVIKDEQTCHIWDEDIIKIYEAMKADKDEAMAGQAGSHEEK